MKPLPPDAVDAALGTLPGWVRAGDALERTLRFPGFTGAITFMHDCAPEIDALDHHPEWTNVYNTVRVRLTTHDAGDQITNPDLVLARLLSAKALLHGGA
ncbi:MAG: 4a-hydroxytetrahydrobiopterin dehydratase [Planctomycetes bacterium]|nr:4a-hydroxytetrahydrobiopterin dehydratase [Planctomycetota bacterium]